MTGGADALATMANMMKSLEDMSTGVSLLTKVVGDHERKIRALEMELARVRASVPPTQKSSILLAH